MALNEVIEARNKLKLTKLDLQLHKSLGKNSSLYQNQISFSKSTSSILTNSKLPIVPLETTNQKTQMIFCVLVPNLKQLFPSQIKISSDHSNISNPDTKTIIQTPCLSLASENKCETPKIVAIDAFI